MIPKKLYVGDSVYVALDEWGGVVLTTENGLGPSNTIILEPYIRELLLENVCVLQRVRSDDAQEGS